MQEHIDFINLAWNLLTSHEQETRLMEVFVKVLLSLLSRKDLLSPAELELPWRPLYLLLEDLNSHQVQMNLKVYPVDFEKKLKSLVKVCRYYFPASATDEILAEFRPYFCPHDHVMTKAISYCALFLPTLHLRKAGCSYHSVLSILRDIQYNPNSIAFNVFFVNMILSQFL